MLLGPYSLEIIVDGSPIPELSEPVKNLKVPTSTGPSYIFNELTGQWHISDSITWAKVRDTGSHFAVRFSSSSVSPWFPLMAFLVIDGQLDYRYVEIYNTDFHSRDHFLSSDKSTKYFFKFNHSIWSDEYQPKGCDFNTRYGGLGAVSLYFYRAKSINEKCDVMPHVDIRQPVLSERKVTRDITISTSFDVTLNHLGLSIPNMNYLQSLYCVPIGVLHLHYRTLNVVSLPIHFPPCEAIARYFTRYMIMDPKQGSKYGESLPIKHELECNEFLSTKQVSEYNEYLSIKQEPECHGFLSIRHAPEECGFTPIKQENFQVEVLASENQKDVNSWFDLNHSTNQSFANFRQEIKKELITPIKIETISMVAKHHDFVDHKKNKVGGGTKKKNKKKSHRSCKKKLRKSKLA
ncbi:3897_t:CDS:2 [Funneliformis geosporum]|uniref:2159_t:CDS:1 n=1 Tax=Funneliformis geosporum TaxID=1117311 RepID=A0A9W4WUY5_9GLOM|nr:2159_t:CDS:2 [Funneliformis geosporum]CAI2166129.1 3897_t:CDS:2 [Funneliformis geosporum]